MKTSNPSDSIYCDGDGFCPVFGDMDLIICSDSNILEESSTRLNRTFKMPEYAKTHPGEFLAGEFNFLLTEIEVYQKIWLHSEYKRRATDFFKLKINKLFKFHFIGLCD